MTTWSADQRYCTAWGIAAILAFLALAFYLNPIGLSQLNPFNTEECEAYKRGPALSLPESTKNTIPHMQNDLSNAEKYYACRLAIYTRDLEIFTAVLAGATLLLFGIGIWQARQLGRHADHTAKLAETASNTATRQLRAYILGNGGSIQVTGTSGHSFPKSAMRPPANIEVTVTFIIKNFGLTPAYDFTVWRFVNLWDVKAPEFGTSGDTIGKDIVGPGAEVSVIASLILSPDDYVAVKSKTKEIYSWGCADYTGAFGQKRYFRFYQVNGREHPTEHGWHLEPAEKPQEAN
jgi:hypothetical protein